MRTICHISHSSHEEVMFRSESDINYAFNCFALACLETESRALADSEMTTHIHLGVATDSSKELFHKYRYKYTRHFNAKYGRKGSIGESKPFILEVDGLLHTQTMLSYVFRQGLHHGLCSTTFGYKHNSVNVVFQKELGKTAPEICVERSHWYNNLPEGAKDIPDGYRMNESGLLLREDVIDTTYVEEVFVTPRNFLYQMNRLSSEEWEKEQEKDNNGLPPVTLQNIEPKCFHSSMSKLLKNESGRNVRNGISDLELCQLIDTDYVHKFGKESIYELTERQRAELGNKIFADIKNGVVSRKLGWNAGLPDLAQIRRCLVIK